VHDDESTVDASSALFMLARELRDAMHEQLTGEDWVAAAGFRPPCMGVISCLVERGPICQREISDQLGIDASDVVGVLDILETAGMIERRRDPEDRRRHAVVLTVDGERAASRLATLRAEAEARVFARLSPDERRTLTELMNRAAGRCEESRSPG